MKISYRYLFEAKSRSSIISLEHAVWYYWIIRLKWVFHLQDFRDFLFVCDFQFFQFFLSHSTSRVNRSVSSKPVFSKNRSMKRCLRWGILVKNNQNEMKWLESVDLLIKKRKQIINVVCLWNNRKQKYCVFSINKYEIATSHSSWPFTFLIVTFNYPLKQVRFIHLFLEKTGMDETDLFTLLFTPPHFPFNLCVCTKTFRIDRNENALSI